MFTSAWLVFNSFLGDDCSNLAWDAKSESSLEARAVLGLALAARIAMVRVASLDALAAALCTYVVHAVIH